ncbi:MAG: magnesium transporter [Acidobacteria bacterium]|nr:magnesium transporter [Acidobacteriota bacterium]
MTTQLLVPEILELLEHNDIDSLREFCTNEHPRVVADHLSSLKTADIWKVLRHLDPDLRAGIFSHFDDDLQVEIAATLPRNELAQLLSDMPPDERVDLFKQIPQERQEKVLPALAQAEREDIRRLAAYPEGTAGSVMTSDYASLPPDITAQEAIDKLRHEAPDKETIYYAYVVDPDRRLLGFLSLKDLILADPNTKLEDMMQREVIFVRATDDQEVAARKIQKYDLIALPVVNGDNALVGIITHDDALDVITQEQTEDMEKMMAIGGSHEAGVYLGTPAWAHFKNRAGWIVGLAAMEIISGWIIHNYESTLNHLMILALYMPMIADTGGNTGSQSATVVVRALALGEVRPKDIFRVLYKELKIAVMLAAVLGVLSWAKVMFLSHNSYIPPGFSLLHIAEVIGIALAVQVVTATLIGALLPLIAAKLKLDPAVVASPALTTIVDITGLLIYFTTASLMLGL